MNLTEMKNRADQIDGEIEALLTELWSLNDQIFKAENGVGTEQTESTNNPQPDNTPSPYQNE